MPRKTKKPTQQPPNPSPGQPGHRAITAPPEWVRSLKLELRIKEQLLSEMPNPDTTLYIPQHYPSYSIFKRLLTRLLKFCDCHYYQTTEVLLKYKNSYDALKRRIEERRDRLTVFEISSSAQRPIQTPGDLRAPEPDIDMEESLNQLKQKKQKLNPKHPF